MQYQVPLHSLLCLQIAYMMAGWLVAEFAHVSEALFHTQHVFTDSIRPAAPILRSATNRQADGGGKEVVKDDQSKHQCMLNQSQPRTRWELTGCVGGRRENQRPTGCKCRLTARWPSRHLPVKDSWHLDPAAKSAILCGAPWAGNVMWHLQRSSPTKRAATYPRDGLVQTGMQSLHASLMVVVSAWSAATCTRKRRAAELTA